MPTYRLINKAVQSNCLAMVTNLPLDSSMEVVIRPYVRKRKDEQSALYWVRLAEISEQAWLGCRQYSPEIWAEYMKAKYLPEQYEQGITLDGYEKYATLPDGSRSVIGSTTKLTTRGFANYLTQVEAFGAELGVLFSARPLA